MITPLRTKWLRLRAIFALGVLLLLIPEFFGLRNWPVIVVQVVLIVGILITSALDVREILRKRTQ